MREVAKERTERDWRKMPVEVYGAMVDTLFVSMPSLVSGLVAAVACAAFTAWVTGNIGVFLLAVLLFGVGVLRVELVKRYRRAKIHAVDGFGRDQIRRWEMLYGLGGWAFALVHGIACFLAITLSDDTSLHLLVNAVTIGYTAGISGRNAARPRLVKGQILLATIPLGIAMGFHGGPIYWTLALCLVLNFLSVDAIASSINGTLGRTFAATYAASDLARRFQSQNVQFDAALNNMSHGLAMLDADGRLLVINGRCLDLYGLFGVEAGTPLAAILRRSPLLRDLIGHERLFDTIGQVTQSVIDGGTATVDLPFAHGRVFQVTCQPMEGGGCVVLTEDVSERRAAEARICHMAAYDTLTNLPNRSKLSEEMRAVAREGRDAAVLLIDLDHFKQVNDTLGHPVGDKLLILVSERMKEAVGERGMVARFGGDEFVLLLRDCPSRDDAAMVAEALIDEISDIYDVDGQRVVIGATVGIAMTPLHGTDADRLIKSADMALYRAKDQARGTHLFYDEAMDAEAQVKHRLDIDLRTAVERNEMILHYQPLFDLATGGISACEALVRWKHPERGMVPPDQFISVAEETGTIVQIGDWVLHEACRVAAGWPTSVRIAVNLSPVQFRFDGLVASVRAALSESGLTADRLELEITESVLITDPDAVMVTLNELRALGVRISLDDFGTGYSSLAYLRTFPFTKVKIDRSFVDDIKNVDGSVIVRAVAMICKDFGMTVTAEGIEKHDQLEALRRDGCMEGQGFYLRRPMPTADVNRLLCDQPGLPKAA